MKKPFKYTLLGKILNKGIIKSAIGEGLNFVPVVGPILSNILTAQKGNGANEISSPIGELDTNKLKLQAIGVIIVGGSLAGLALAMGWLTFEQIKDLVYLIADVI